MNGLRIDVYRAGDYDCTMNGISSRHDHLTLIGKGISGPFEPSADAPAVTMITRQIGGREPYKYLVPCDENAQPLPGWWMFGGNYGETSDSRFPNSYPLSIHDRQENKPAQVEPVGELVGVVTGKQLEVKFKGVMKDYAGNEFMGTWKQRFNLQFAGQKIAAELQGGNVEKILSIRLVDRIELRPKKG